MRTPPDKTALAGTAITRAVKEAAELRKQIKLTDWEPTVPRAAFLYQPQTGLRLEGAGEWRGYGKPGTVS